MSDTVDPRFKANVDRFADDVSQRASDHDSRMARSASMDATFGNDVGAQMRLSSLMRSDDRDTSREAGHLFWANVRSGMRRR